MGGRERLATIHGNGPSWEDYHQAMAISDDAEQRVDGSVSSSRLVGPRQDM